MKSQPTRATLMRALLDAYDELYVKQNDAHKELIELVKLEYTERFPEYCYTIGQFVYIDYDILMDHMWATTIYDAPPKPVEVVRNIVKCTVDKVIHRYSDIDGEIHPNCDCCITYKGEYGITCHTILPANQFKTSP